MGRLALLLSVLALFVAVPAAHAADAQDTPAAASSPTPGAAPGVSTAALPTAIPAAEGPVVQGVFYFSPSCGHCHYVITEVLPGLFEEHGGEFVVTFDQSVLPDEPAFYLMSNGRLQLLMVDVTQPDGQTMYLADAEALGFAKTPGVPLLHIGDEWYLGSADIPDNLPRIVGAGLAGNGVRWPPVPGIATAVAPFIAAGSVGDGAGQDVVLPSGGDETPLDKVARDPLGNGISIVVLVALLASLVLAPVLASRGSLPAFPSWPVPLLAVVGLGIAAYLASIEINESEAVCGPVGDCNTVQQSGYARLLGIPVGVLGVAGYVGIGGLWMLSRAARGPVADGAQVLIALGAFGGTLFSAYLTFLEPFVIGATCLWCISSAIVMLLLLWVSVGPGWAAWRRLRGGDRRHPAAAAGH